jgi:hypothetical protein
MIVMATAVIANVITMTAAVMKVLKALSESSLLLLVIVMAVTVMTLTSTVRVMISMVI